MGRQPPWPASAGPAKANPAWQYAAARNALYDQGKTIEILAGYEPHLRAFGEWWKQLSGRARARTGRASSPPAWSSPPTCTPWGQYIQEGKRDLFETVVRFTIPQSSCLLDPRP